jgi:hypothetical protein
LIAIFVVVFSLALPLGIILGIRFKLQSGEKISIESLLKINGRSGPNRAAGEREPSE